MTPYIKFIVGLLAILLIILIAVTSPKEVNAEDSYETCTSESLKLSFQNLKSDFNKLMDWMDYQEQLSPKINLDFYTKSNSNQVLINYDERVFLIGQGKDYWLKCSGSMKPIFDCSDTLIGYKPRNKDEIFVGDIIGFRNPKKELLVIHQIIASTEDLYFTKGYANNNINNSYKLDLLDVELYDVDEYHPTFEDIEYKLLGVLWK